MISTSSLSFMTLKTDEARKTRTCISSDPLGENTRIAAPVIAALSYIILPANAFTALWSKGTGNGALLYEPWRQPERRPGPIAACVAAALSPFTQSLGVIRWLHAPAGTTDCLTSGSWYSCCGLKHRSEYSVYYIRPLPNFLPNKTILASPTRRQCDM